MLFALAVGAGTSFGARCADAAPAETAPVAAENGPAPYRIQGGETVKLIVPAAVGESLLQTIYDDGLICLPTGSTLNIRGKTISEAQQMIKDKIATDSALRQVFAVLVVTQFPPRRIYINGEVKYPQALPVAPGSDLSLAAILTAAGALLPQADLSRVNVVHTNADGKRVATVVDASRLGRPGNSDLGPTLQAGDIVTVPRGAVYVLAGEVARPGTVTRSDLLLAPGEQPRLSRVLFSTGGLRNGANRRSVRIIRQGADGNQSVINVDLEAALSSHSTTFVASNDKNAPEAAKFAVDSDPILQDGDMIVAGGGTGGVIVPGNVRAPGLYPLPAGTTKLSHVIAQAGGFAEFAKTSAVTVTHAGSHTSEKVDVGAIIKDGAISLDVDLEDGDVVYVGGGVM